MSWLSRMLRRPDDAMPVPRAGVWEEAGFPDELSIGGRRFLRARRAKTRPGVVAQYREERARWSAHLKVRVDGTWYIDHHDKVNPDMGSLLAHGLLDTALGQALLSRAGTAWRWLRGEVRGRG